MKYKSGNEVFGFHRAGAPLYFLFRLQFFCKFLGDAVVQAAARLCGESDTVVHHAVPAGLVQVVQFVVADVQLQQAVDDAGVEVAACADGADGFDRRNGITLADAGRAQGDVLVSGSTDEVAAVEFDFVRVDFVHILQVVHVEEIVDRTADDVGVFQVLDDGGSQFDGLFLVRGAEVGVVVDDGFLGACHVQQFHDFVAQHGVQGVVGTEDDDVVFVYFGQRHVEPLAGIVFVKEVCGVVLFVEEGERYGRLAFGEDVDVFCGYAVVAHEPEDDVAYPVVARLTDEADGNARTAQ